MISSIDFAIQAHSSGVASLPAEFWDLSREQQIAEADKIADAILLRREQHAEFLATYGHFLPLGSGVAKAKLRCAFRPNGLQPPEQPPLVLSAYRQPSGPSIGLGVNAGLTAATLRKAGIPADALSLVTTEQLRGVLDSQPTIRLVVLEGFWIVPDELASLAESLPFVVFVARCHSQVAFLQIEPDTISRMRAVLELSKRTPNLHLAGNSRRLVDWTKEAWNWNCLHLPNLYDLPLRQLPRPRKYWHTLRLASFGAPRLQKHHSVAAAAAAIVSRRLRRDVEFFVNCGRQEPGGESVLRSIRNLLADVHGVRLVESPWQSAAEFRRLVATMDLCFQLSSSETFNLVTADAAAAGVPSIVGESIDWAPSDCVAEIDDPLQAANLAMLRLSDQAAGRRWRAALESHCLTAIYQWRRVYMEATGESCPAEAAAAAHPA